MRAAYLARLDGDEPLDNLAVGELPEPTLGDRDVLVRVEAAALNHHDLWSLKGVSSRPLTPPQILGCDAAGRVERVGGALGNNAPAVGSRVVVHSVMSCGGCAACLAGDPLLCRRLGLLSEPPYGGTLAELLGIPVANVVPLPDAVSMETAACLPTAYLTAYRMLFTKARLRPGMSILVQGASGGVATAAILLARRAGITVYATSRDEAKRRTAEQLGATATFAPNDAAAKAILGASGGGVDAVVETVGEPTWDLSLRAVRAGGTVAVAGATAGANPPAQLARIFWRHITIAGTSMGTREELQRLVDLCALGELEPLIGATFDLADVALAFRELANGEVTGKIVIRL